MPHAPLRIFGNTYYVGTNLWAILITSPTGHVLIDGGLPESAPLILANIRALGFRTEDVKLIVNSHAHFDHAGGIAELRRATGAEVARCRGAPRRWNVGTLGRGSAVRLARISDGRIGKDDRARQTAGAISITAHVTGGHTPGGTTWTWRSCERDQCYDFVYADSQTPVRQTISSSRNRPRIRRAWRTSGADSKCSRSFRATFSSLRTRVRRISGSGSPRANVAIHAHSSTRTDVATTPPARVNVSRNVSRASVANPRRYTLSRRR